MLPTEGRLLDYVTIQHEESVAVLTIDRQEKLNALDRQVVEEIGQALLELEAEGPRAIVVRGAGFYRGGRHKGHERHGSPRGQALLRDRTRCDGPPRQEPRPYHSRRERLRARRRLRGSARVRR